MLPSAKPSTFLTYCDKIAFILLCIVTIDTCIFGAGELISIGPIGFRQVLLVLLGLASIPVVISKRKELLRNKYLWFVGAFLVWVVISVFWGPTDAQAIEIIMPSFNSFIYFIILPIALVLISSKRRVYTLMKCVIWGSLLLSIIAIIHLVLYLYAPSSIMDYLIETGYDLYFSRVAFVSDTIPRLVFLSGLYMIGGCVFSVYFSITEKNSKSQWLYWITTALSLFALLISYTRAIYLGMIVSAIGVFVTILISKNKQHLKKLAICTVASLAIFGIVLSGFSILARTNYFSYAFTRSAIILQDPIDSDSSDGESSDTDKFNELTQLSDQGRIEVITRLIDNIKRSPIIGNGFGSDVSTEYFFLDIWGKSGIIGLLLFLLPLFEIFRQIFINKKQGICSRKTQVMWLSLLLGIMTYSLLNPYISSYLGIFVYSCTMAITTKSKTTEQ